MKVVGSAVVGAERGRVWAALQDPAVLVRTIPGCRRLEAAGADTYRMTVSAGVASIKGVYEGEVALSEPDEPEAFTLRARGTGAPGTVDATVRVRLSEVEGVDGGATRVDYDAEAVVGGMIGGVGQRVLGSVAKKTAGEFFTAVDHHLRRTAPETVPVTAPAAGEVVPVPAGTAPALAGTADVIAHAAPGQVFERPRPERAGTPVWPVLTAFGMGAGISLGSAVIGWLLGRSGRRR
ncbi:carbon monoxide dehydrogenase subunit G [Sphaerisporangium siamense]|uniref:Carbon monoxide dehydrogenase subunit G n=1 Tax=Sphaerisporangium siamense TaxID=795645 RepID=A0A7W7DA81_9ACTN|nr:carbon monoxide dehydrogenase subunit G [Sphaerisporangium siamense]MBB4702829.1 carbon monoxide dehydrogenase subunit G [Sphaerisporangium siamense]GII83415.1 carbon monoxide dehydrogenase subunit G [Sphaerisporangium siamense]